jgi:hypothetical protein
VKRQLNFTGNPNGSSLYHRLEVLGKEKVMQRLRCALAHAGFSKIPVKFILRIGIFIRDSYGLPNAEHATSKSKAREMFGKLHLISSESQVQRVLQEDREGAFSLLIACLVFASSHGTPISLPDIEAAKFEDTEWDRVGMLNASITWFLMEAIDAMK